MNIYNFWKDVLAQDADAIRTYFDKNAYINWHCTNEHFSVEEFITANCEYPDNWGGEVERVEQINGLLITVTHVYSENRECSCHVTSFIKLVNDKIAAVDEYWADDGIAPDWRLEMRIGKAITEKKTWE